MISILILTKNEEIDISNCIKSVEWSDDIVVLDSYSTDKTTELASGLGAKLVYREFDNYANQRNYGLNEINYKNNWVLMLDADERVPEDLHREMLYKVGSEDQSTSMFKMRRKDFFLGQWLKYSTTYKSLWFGRLAKVGQVRVERSINEEFCTDGKIEYLDNAIVHYPFSKGLHAWFDKHNKYSTMEAELAISNAVQTWGIKDFFSKDPSLKRRALKLFIYSLPGKPIVMFIGRYIFARGFLDGRAGLTFCVLKTIYEYMIDCKIRELRQKDKATKL